jgi:hypothetical protein
VAVDWDDTKILDAEPGDYIIIARKAKGKQNWFLGAITDENARSFGTTLSFLDTDKNISPPFTVMPIMPTGVKTPRPM